MPLFEKNYTMIPEYLKMATISEVAFESIKHEACGNTVQEALKRLTDLCICHFKPEPQLVPGYEDSYYCGTIDVKNFIKSKKRYNTVWFKKQNNMILVTVYFPYN